MTTLPTTTAGTPLITVADVRRDMLAAFTCGKKGTTVRAYTRDLRDFARFLGAEHPNAAIALLVGQGQGEANVKAHAYRAWMLEKRLSPATVNRRLSALRSVVRLARTFGLVSWGLDVTCVPSQAYRNTAGPGTPAFQAMLRNTEDPRDRAILRLLFDVALRRGEIESLDLEHVRPQGEGLSLEIQGKGRWERELLELPAPTAEALAAWLEMRGTAPGPLFLNRDSARKGVDGRLSSTSIYRIVQAAAARAEVPGPVSPHRLRHSAITRAAKLLQGDMVKLAKFSRHRDIRTAARYVDNEQGVAASVARQVADLGTDEEDS